MNLVLCCSVHLLMSYDVISVEFLSANNFANIERNKLQPVAIDST